jgi:hypothetical protein
MIAPIVRGALLMIDPSFPVYGGHCCVCVVEYLCAVDQGGR